MSAQQDLSLPTGSKLSQIGRAVRKEFKFGIGLFLLLYIAEFISMHRLPPGEVFDLRPKGFDQVNEFIERALIMTAFLVIYTLPAFSVRKSIARLLRIFMIGLFIVFTTSLEMDQVIAVIRSGPEFVMIKRWPMSAVRFSEKKLPAIELRADEKGQMMFLNWPGDYGLNHTLTCSFVNGHDVETLSIEKHLITILRSAGANLEIR